MRCNIWMFKLIRQIKKWRNKSCNDSRRQFGNVKGNSIKNYIILLQVKTWALKVKNSIDRLNSRFVWYNHLRKECNIILKVKHSHSLYLSKCISWNNIKMKSRDKNNDVYSSAVHNSTNLETTQMFTDRRVDK